MLPTERAAGAATGGRSLTRRLEGAAAGADQISMPLSRLLLTIAAALALALPAAAEAGARHCPGTSSLAQLRASGTSCATAKRIASQSAAIRRDTSRYAAARHCAGDFCIVVSGWRCRPARTPEPRERCTRGGAAIRWLYR
jgi:hypothetical protein